ncbi:MAG: class I SAM-dependent methyltransferase [Verrucomicrobia bacterium]|nr:class I SAM-dependent methyltransferase [Verrucomicrobiota bacterium]
MKPLQQLHTGLVHPRRVRVLAGLIAAWLPQGGKVLDVGCGDGALAAAIAELRPDVQISGLDVLVRPSARIPVVAFDGRTIPHGDGCFDVALLVDVLHHTEAPEALLREARRVARMVVVKDHTLDGWMAGPTLRLMDWVGNASHGVALPYNYRTEAQWREMFAALDLRIEELRGDLGLYPWLADLVFGRRLHLLARLTPEDSA